MLLAALSVATPAEACALEVSTLCIAKILRVHPHSPPVPIIVPFDSNYLSVCVCKLCKERTVYTQKQEATHTKKYTSHNIVRRVKGECRQLASPRSRAGCITSI